MSREQRLQNVIQQHNPSADNNAYVAWKIMQKNRDEQKKLNELTQEEEVINNHFKIKKSAKSALQGDADKIRDFIDKSEGITITSTI